jgi:hypothetical protein
MSLININYQEWEETNKHHGQTKVEGINKESLVKFWN